MVKVPVFTLTDMGFGTMEFAVETAGVFAWKASGISISRQMERKRCIVEVVNDEYAKYGKKVIVFTTAGTIGHISQNRMTFFVSVHKSKTEQVRQSGSWQIWLIGIKGQDDVFHLPKMFLHALQQFELSSCPLQVMPGEAGFEIVVAVEVVGQEPQPDQIGHIFG